jgi:hypothetical protein
MIGTEESAGKMACYNCGLAELAPPCIWALGLPLQRVYIRELER